MNSVPTRIRGETFPFFSIIAEMDEEGILVIRLPNLSRYKIDPWIPSSVWIGFFTLIAATIIMQICIKFVPHSSDFSHGALKTIFSMLPRITIASLTAYIFSQFSLLIGPFIYFYFISIVDKKFHLSRKSLIHFVPFTIISVYLIYSFYILHTSPNIWIFSERNVGIIFLLQSFIYLTLSYKKLKLYRNINKPVDDKIQKPIANWLKLLLIAFITIWIINTHMFVILDLWQKFTLLPILNIISGAILIGALRSDPDLGEKAISDENVSLKRLLIGTFIITIIFLICQLYFELIWAATFSICMVWIGNLERAVNSIFLKHNIIGY